MQYDKSKSRFSSIIRIDPKQKEYVKTHRGEYRTMAGRLDEIINHYKKCLRKKLKRPQEPKHDTRLSSGLVRPGTTQTPLDTS